MRLKKILARVLIACLMITQVSATAFAAPFHTFTVYSDSAHSAEQFGDHSVRYSRGSSIQLDGYAFGVNAHPATMSFYVEPNPGYCTPSDVKVNGTPAVDAGDHWEFKAEAGGKYRISAKDGNPIGNKTYPVTAIENRFGAKAEIEDLGEGSRKKFYEAETVVVIPTFTEAYPRSDYHAANVVIYGQLSETCYEYESHYDGDEEYYNVFTFAMPDEPVSVFFEYEANDPDVYGVITKCAPRDCGEIKMISESFAYEGEKVSFTVAQEPNCTLKYVAVSDPRTGFVLGREYQPKKFPDGTYEFTMPAQNVVVTAHFEKSDVFDIVLLYDDDCGDSFVSSDKYVASKGESVHFAIEPDEGYYAQQIVASVVDRGVTPAKKWEVALVPSTVEGYDWMYTLDHPQLKESKTKTRYVELYTKFVRQEGYAAATVIGEGEVIFSGDGYQKPGELASMKIMPAEGYRLLGKNRITSTPEVILTEVGSGEYTFRMPEGGVEFEVCLDQMYAVTSVDYDHLKGTVSVDEDVFAGDKVEISVTSYDGFIFDDISVETAGGDKLPVTYPAQVHKEPGVENVFSFVMPEDNVSVNVDFVKNGTAYSVKFDSMECLDASMTETLIEAAEPFDAVTVEVVPAAGMRVKKMLFLRHTGGDGEWVELTQTVAEETRFVEGRGWVSTYSFLMPNGDVMLHGEYEEAGWTLNVADSDCLNAYVDEPKPGLSTQTKYDPKTANYGDTIVVTAVYDALDIVSISVKNLVTEGSVPVTAIGTDKWMFTMPDASVEVQAVYTAKKFSVTAASGLAHGSVSVAPVSSEAAYGRFEESAVIAVTTVPETGYETESVTAGSIEVRKLDSTHYEFDMPAADVTVTAAFRETIEKIVTEGRNSAFAARTALDTVVGKLERTKQDAEKTTANSESKKKVLKDTISGVEDAISSVNEVIKLTENANKALTEALTAKDRTKAISARTAAEALIVAAESVGTQAEPAIAAAKAAMALAEVSVKFDTDGGTIVPEQWLLKGEKAQKPADPKKDGYNFTGWFGNKEGGKFDFGTAIEKGATIYAVWTAVSHGGGSSGGGSVNSSSSPAPTFSRYWEQDAAGIWRVRDKAGNFVANAWLCDNAILGNGQNVWYLLNPDGSMITAGLVQDNTGNYYSIEMNHNGYYGMLRYKNGIYDGIYMEFSQKHDGTFGAVTNQSAIDALKAKYGVTKFDIDNSNCVFTKDF